MAPETNTPAWQLPVLVATTVEVGRLIGELQRIDEALLQLELREGSQGVKIPRTTQLMDHLIKANRLNLLKPPDRTALLQFLETVRATAPVLHIGFSADPSPLFIEKLVSWLRREIHPEVLITVGLQPNIGAGCVVRGNSKYFDFSLKQEFAAKRGMLLKSLALEKPA